MQRNVECPSGLEGSIRGLKGRELRLLSDKRKAKSGELFDDLLAACWVGITNPGPYRADANGAPPWLDMLSGDRFYLLIQMRLATYPEEPYTFTAQCTSPMCGETFEWEVPLDQLPIRRLPPESLERFSQGQPFETTIAGARVLFALSTGRHERQGARFVKGANADVIRVLSHRIIDIEGVGRDPKAKVAWLEDRELSEHRDIIAAFDAVDCGVETEIEVQCPDCGGIQRVDLPFGAAFFMPKRK